MTDQIQSYQWTGINKQGSRIKGIIQAVDLKTAETSLKNMDIEVISILPKKSSNLTIFRKKVKSREIVLFTRYLSTMLTAGMPILKALDVIARDNENPVLKSVIVSIRTSISAGTTFADSLAQFPQYFSELYSSLVRAGEKSATLDVVLAQLARYLEKIEAIKRKIRNASIYPIAIITVALAVSLILLIFVIPQFQSMFASAGVPLPYFTRMVIGLSEFLRSYWWLLIAIIGGAIWTLRSMKRKNPKFAKKWDLFILRIYIIGPIYKKSIIARFTRTLAITLNAGMPIVEAMKSMVNIMGNKIYSAGVENICENISSGHALSSSMEATKLFPNMVIQMITVGEASGALGDMLNNIANYYEEEVNSIADNLSVLLEPIIIVVLGIIIGAFVIAMYLPIFKLGSTI